MTYSWLAMTVLVLWVLTGVVLGVVMTRRGYSGYGWGVVGTVLGPLAVIVALFARPASRRDEVTSTGVPGRGPTDVLAGIDGSAAAIDAAASAADLLDGRLGRFTLAIVAPMDSTPEEEAAAKDVLTAALAELVGPLACHGVTPGTMVLHGQPADVLRRRAEQDGYSALAIGAHGRGASKAILGSAASSLMRVSPVPLIVSGRSEVLAELRSARPGTTVGP